MPFQDLEIRLDEMTRQRDEAREALKALWYAATWGAGKGAVFEAHKKAILAAGVEDIGA